MQRIKYSDKSFDVQSIIGENFNGKETITIEFYNTDFPILANFFDVNANKNTLAKFEVYSVTTLADGTETEVLQGIHNGYTMPIDISFFGGVGKVKIERESFVERTLKEQQEIIENLLIANL